MHMNNVATLKPNRTKRQNKNRKKKAEKGNFQYNIVVGIGTLGMDWKFEADLSKFT